MFIKEMLSIKLMLLLLCGAWAGLAMSRVAANCDQNVVLEGVNIAGAEFNAGRLPGVLNKDYVYPNSVELDYFASIGAHVIRLPFLWERIQPSLFGELEPAQLLNLVATVGMANSRGMCVILDVHSYGAYKGSAIGTSAVPVKAFIDLWIRLAAKFPDASATAFGLMNEPSNMPIDEWAAAAQQTVNELRKNGAKNLIFASGGRWSGVHEWEKQIGKTSNAAAFAHFQDPLKRTLIEVHQYADPYYSGTGAECEPAANFVTMFANITRWAKTNGQRLFLGEFGVPPTSRCLEDLDVILAQMKDESVWRGWTYWAAGSWWGDYPLSIQMRGGVEPAQTKILRKYFAN